jgi:nitroreductase
VIKDADCVGRLARLAGGARTFAHEIPALVVLVGSLGVSPTAGDRHLMYIDGSLAAMNFMLALQSQAYASCPINWPDQVRADAEMANALALAPYERPLMLMAVGKAAPGAMVACSTRKGLKELLEIK